MNNNLEEKIKELRKGYINKLKDSFCDFKVLSEENQIDIQVLYQKVHTISGTSGMYGLKEISDSSTEFEIYLKPFKETPNSINVTELKEKILIYVKDLEKILSEGE